jgi:hypothetical protein
VDARLGQDQKQPVQNGECKLISRNFKNLRFESLKLALAKLAVKNAMILARQGKPSPRWRGELGAWGAAATEKIDRSHAKNGGRELLKYGKFNLSSGSVRRLGQFSNCKAN